MDDLFLLLFLVSIPCIFVALIKPSLFVPVLKGWATRKRATSLFATAAIGFFTLFGITAEPVEPTQQAETTENATQEPQNDPEAAAVGAAPVTQEEVVSVEEQKPTLYEVVRVTDGDTLTVSIEGKIETLRLIGMDTPETVDPRTQVQCFGKEASTKAKDTLTGKKVRVEADDSQGDKDKYGRLLRYIWLEDGTFFNKMMIEEGFAHEYTYSSIYKYQAEFKEAEKSAQENKRGLWGDTLMAILVNQQFQSRKQ